MDYGPYPDCYIVEVHDGDTIYMHINVGFDITIFGRCRVYGINAPELKTDAGKKAKEYAQALLPVGTKVKVLSHDWDKFGGRFDGTITLPNDWDFATLMVQEGHAVEKKY